MAISQIMVVDDDPGVLKVLELMLNRGGFAVLTARNTEATIDILEQSTPDLMLVDMTMPGQSSLELCKAVRQRNSTASMPIIALIEHGNQDHIQTSINAGANDYLAKPILHQNLFAKVNLALSEYKQV